MPHPNGLAAAKACATPGLCLFCEEPLPPRLRKPRVICGGRACTAAYHTAWHRDHPESGKRPPAAGFTTWHCGCGLVTRRGGWGMHKKNCMYAAIAYPVVVVPAMRSAA